MRRKCVGCRCYSDITSWQCAWSRLCTHLGATCQEQRKEYGLVLKGILVRTLDAVERCTRALIGTIRCVGIKCGVRDLIPDGGWSWRGQRCAGGSRCIAPTPAAIRARQAQSWTMNAPHCCLLLPRLDHLDAHVHVVPAMQQKAYWADRQQKLVSETTACAGKVSTRLSPGQSNSHSP